MDTSHGGDRFGVPRGYSPDARPGTESHLGTIPFVAGTSWDHASIDETLFCRARRKVVHPLLIFRRRLLRKTAHLVWRVGELFGRGRKKPGTDPFEPGFGTPVSLFVAISHWREGDGQARSTYLRTIIRSLHDFDVTQMQIVVVTNKPADVLAELKELSLPSSVRLRGRARRWKPAMEESRVEIDGIRRPLVAIDVVEWTPRLGRSSPYLAWAHKGLMREALRKGAFTHFAYLEDDMLLKPEHLRYWLRCRHLLRDTGLIPAFVRFENGGFGDFLTDQLGCLDPLSVMEIDTDCGNPSLFVQMPIPYQGMYLMDRNLAEDHFANSPFRSSFLSRLYEWWGILERAATGPIFEMRLPWEVVPRNVTPVERDDEGNPVIHHECLIEHLPANYANDHSSPLAKVPLSRAFG